MILTVNQLDRIAKGKFGRANATQFVDVLNDYGPPWGLSWPHRLAHMVAQLMHETYAFRYDRELWGPTPAQERYDTRTDLGNTPERDGDGFLFRGRAGIQITGRANYIGFYKWCLSQGYGPPDFETAPSKVLESPWEGLAPIWYWVTRDLNRYADANDIEMISRRINGGWNGYGERVEYYTRTALVFLAYKPTEVKTFQRAAELVVDGIAGPATRAALHSRLKAL